VPANRRLNSWKDIAGYLGASVRTVQRWEEIEHLPVHRHAHAKVGTVYAFAEEIDQWLKGRRTVWLAHEPSSRVTPAGPVPAAGDEQSRWRLIVLPFRLVKPDPEIEFLAFGLADALTTSLSGIDSLIVRSSLVAARYAGDVDFKRIAAETQVNLVVAGSLLRDGNELRVNAQLVETARGTAVASHTVRGELRNIFELQDRMVGQILDWLALPSAGRIRAPLRRDAPSSPAAYEHYLRANELAYNFDPAARDLYARCLELDPNYAPAWARLGRCCRISAKFGGDPEDFNRAEHALEHALALNPDLALAHNQLAYLEADSGRAEQAMVRLLLQTEAAGHNPELLAGLVHVCRFCGLLEPSLKAHERVSRLDPTIRTSVCHTYFMRGEYQKALETSNEVLGFLGPLTLLALGRKQDALALGREMERIRTPLPLVRSAFTWVRALAETSRAEALRVLESALSLLTHGPEELFYAARSFAYLSDIERALVILARAVDEGFFCYPALTRDPWLDSVRGTPEFIRIMRRALEQHTAAFRAYVETGGERILGAGAPEHEAIGD
jgi:TolB-like protein